MVIQRQTLRSQVREELLQRMKAGDFAPGSGINEAQLATELGVSRTPLREALIALENEGLIESTQGKGFRFTPVSPDEFKELCPVLAALEGLALESSPAEHLASIAPELLRRAHAFPANVERHGVITQLDDEWHDLLLSGCPNGRLIELITALKLALHRYESIMIADEELIERSAAEHTLIAERVAAADVPGAIDALRANWINSMDRVVGRFRALSES